MAMQASTSDQQGVRVLQLSGHVSSSEVHALLAELAKLKDAPDGRVVLDVALLKNLPTAAIGGLIELIRALEQRGGRLVMAAPDSSVRVPLERLGVSPMVTITESVDEAVEMLSPENPGS
jgi:anti-anti-sigma factor